MKTIKRQYITPEAELIELTTDDLMIYFSIGEGGDDEDEAGAKGMLAGEFDDELEDEEDEDFRLGCHW